MIERASRLIAGLPAPTAVWTASAFLTAGLAASLLLRGRPSRAHLALWLAMLGAVLAPVSKEAVRRCGGGLWAAKTRAVVPGPVAGTTPAFPAAMEKTVARPPIPSGSTADLQTLPSGAISDHRGGIPWRGLGLASWGVASLFLLGRLISSFAEGRRLARSAAIEAAGGWCDAVDEAARGLGLRAGPRVGRSFGVRGPMIWCWGRRPLLLLPSEDEGPDVDRVAVCRHELAHWRRRDHLTAMLAEGLVVAWPWHPLAWAARSRLARLAEFACDDWALAAGTPASAYAATLLKLAPQRLATMPGAVSPGPGLRGRLARILTGRPGPPRAGSLWTAVACVVALGTISLVAGAQPRPSGTTSESGLAFREEPDMEKVVGRVLDAEGRPVAGARAYVVGERATGLPLALRAAGGTWRDARRFTIGPVVAAEGGRFEVAIPGEVREESCRVIVAAAGFGLGVERVGPGGEVEVRLSAEAPITGVLRKPDGSPAAGAVVRLLGFHDDVSGKGAFVEGDDELPDAWPKPAEADAEGRFTLRGVPVDTYAVLSARHPECADDDVYVSTFPDRRTSPAIRAFEIEPLEPSFERTLSPARPAEGRVVDAETGRPLAGVTVAFTPMGRHGSRAVSAVTDADGRYRASGRFADVFYFSVDPDPESGYLGATASRQGWPEGARALTVDFALRKGRRIAGRVVDRDRGRPVAGAAVAYRHASGDPNAAASAVPTGPVATDAEGRFEVFGLAGPGYLVVETDDPGRLRVRRTPPGRGVSQEGRAIAPQGYAEVVVPEQDEPAPVEIEIRRGVTIEARAVDPEGRPIDEVAATYPSIGAVLGFASNRSRDLPGGVLRIEGADPDRTYRVLFASWKRRLGAVVELKYDPAGGPTLVALRPSATVVGRVVGPDGAPMRGVPVFARAVYEAGRPGLPGRELYDGDRSEFYANLFGEKVFDAHGMETDDEGRFRFEALIPGVGCHVAAMRGEGLARAAAWDLGAGEVRDLGTLRFEEAGR